jgi:hypothetical protein
MIAAFLIRPYQSGFRSMKWPIPGPIRTFIMRQLYSPRHSFSQCYILNKWLYQEIKTVRGLHPLSVALDSESLLTNSRVVFSTNGPDRIDRFSSVAEGPNRRHSHPVSGGYGPVRAGAYLAFGCRRRDRRQRWSPPRSPGRMALVSGVIGRRHTSRSRRPTRRWTARRPR